jgi:hypothetical protein
MSVFLKCCILIFVTWYPYYLHRNQSNNLDGSGERERVNVFHLELCWAYILVVIIFYHSEDVNRYDLMKGKETDRACSMHGRDQMHTKL